MSCLARSKMFTRKLWLNHKEERRMDEIQLKTLKRKRPKVVPYSTRTVVVLGMLYPGKWKCRGNHLWSNGALEIERIGDRFYRTDSMTQIPFPEKRKRNHFIHTILDEVLGGTWERIDELTWKSDDHDFHVYRSHKYNGKKTAYRRSDTREIVYEANGYRFYRKG